MPFNPMVQDRSAEIMMRGMEGLGSGIGQGLANLGQMIAKKQEEDKRRVQNAKIAENIIKTNPEWLKSVGMSSDQFMALGADDKIATSAGLIQGMMNKRDAARLRMAEEEHQEQLKFLRERGAGLEQERARRAAQPGMMAEMQRLMNGEAGGNAIRDWMEDSPAGASMPRGRKMGMDEAFLQAGAQTGGASDEMMDRMMVLSARSKEKPELHMEDAPNGDTVVTFGNSVLRFPKKETKPEAPVGDENSWVYMADEKEFASRLAKIKDPKVVQGILETRNKLRQATAKPSDPYAFFNQYANPQGQKAQESKSNRRRFNMKTMQWEN